VTRTGEETLALRLILVAAGDD